MSIKNKWANFKKANSSNIDIASPEKKKSSLIKDWQRVVHDKNFTINGVILENIAENYNSFKNDSDMDSFIKKEILRDFTGNDAQITQAISYLKNTLHQGGLMFPVSSALTSSLKTKKGSQLGVMDDCLEKKTNIITYFSHQ